MQIGIVLINIIRVYNERRKLRKLGKKANLEIYMIVNSKIVKDIKGFVRKASFLTYARASTDAKRAACKGQLNVVDPWQHTC